ncbi:hypothetical protein GZL_02902 [Streptomyces sp. 769]|nr:hypothetical protein GZL_02902 [Streptomyces sp. 769]
MHGLGLRRPGRRGAPLSDGPVGRLGGGDDPWHALRSMVRWGSFRTTPLR